jgi:hypothetical protein
MRVDDQDIAQNRHTVSRKRGSSDLIQTRLLDDLLEKYIAMEF